ncbi:MAG TPA: DUF5996 family protein [Acidimicrobiia bacterium]|nr:DUF5996 family protein [Acidimicrobiia bacterium]
MAETRHHRWPALPIEEWTETRDTLHLWAQVVGKVRMANEPLVNHRWNVPLYVSATGLTTSLVPHPSGPAFQVDFDVVASRLEVTTVTRSRRACGCTRRAPTRRPPPVATGTGTPPDAPPSKGSDDDRHVHAPRHGR